MTKRDHRPLLWATIAVGVCLLAGWAFWLSAELLDQSKQNGRLAREASRAAERIEACTTPGSRCYDRSQKELARAVNGINESTLRIVAATLLCYTNEGAETEAELIDCVTRELGS